MADKELPSARFGGLTFRAMQRAAESDAIKQQLIDTTQDALERGVFGAPSMLIEPNTLVLIVLIGLYW